MQWILNRRAAFKVIQIPHPAIEAISTQDVVVANGFSCYFLLLLNKNLAVGGHDCCNFGEVS